MQNTEFDVFAINYFSVVFITDAHRDTAENVVFGFSETEKCVNPSKSPVQKFDPKTMLSLPYMGKRKQYDCPPNCRIFFS